MSQVNTNLSDLPQSPTPSPMASIRGFTGPQYRRKLGDLTATFIRDNSMGAMGGITGMGFRTFGGVVGDYLLDDQFDQLTKDWGVRDQIFHPNATMEDIWNAIPLPVKNKFDENGWNPRQNAKTPDELRHNLAYAAVYPMASEDANEDAGTAGYWATAFGKLGIDILGDPTNLLGFAGEGTKLAGSTGVRLLSNKIGPAANLVAGEWATAFGKVLERKTFAGKVVQMGGLNALQTYAQSIEGEASMQDALGINREQDWIQHGVAGTIGFGFGALFPVVIAGATMGAIKVATTSLNALKSRLDQESQNVVVRAILDTTKPMTSVGKIRLEDGALTAVGIVQGSEIVQEAAYQMHRLYKDPKVEIDRWADAHWWERHENTGVTPAVFLKWVTEFNPNRAELTGMLDSLEREAAINRQAQRSNSTLNKIIDQTWKGMGSKRLRIEGVHVGVEPLEPVPGEVVDFDVPVAKAAPLPTKPTDGWKLHLSVEEANRSVVSDLLKAHGYAHKVGHNSGQQGKDITVYIGSRLDAEDAAKKLSDMLDQYLVMPKGEVLADDRKFFRKIYGRFDIGRHDPRFHQYGSKGTPFLLKDMDPWNKRDPLAAFTDADKLLAETYGKYYTGQDTPVVATQAVSTLYEPPSLFGPPRPVTVDGSIKLTINGALERGLMTLMRYRGANAKGVRAAVMKRLVAMTGWSEKTIYHVAAKLHNDIGTKVRKARNDLVNVPVDKSTRLRITPRGAYVTDINIPDGHALKLWGPNGDELIKGGIADMISTLPASLKKVRDEVNAPRVDLDTQYKQAAEYIDSARALRQQDDNAPVGAPGDRVRTKNIAKVNRKAQTNMAKALSEFEPGSRMVTPAEVLSEVSHGVLEKPLGVTVEPHESRKIFKNVMERFGLEDNWLVKNGWGKVSKLSRKVGHALIDVGHLATVGSEVPIIAHLSKFVSSIALYNDAFGRIRGYVGPGLEQLHNQTLGKYGDKVLKMFKMLKDLPPDLHESAMRYALARITETTLPGKMPNGIAAHVERMVPELEKMFREIGDRGLSNGYFRSLDDNYAGGFAIKDTKRNKPVDLAEALHTVLHRYFGAEDDAPIHRRTFNEVPGAHVRDEKTGNYISNKAVYPEKAPRTVGEMTPDHKRQYMELLAKRDDKVGLWAEAVKIAQNKLGHTELKTVHDTLELATPDPRRQRQLKVGIWFEPELHPFIDWSPQRVIDTYGERVGYRIEEKEAVNFLIKQLTGETRKDFDVDMALSGIKDSLLADPKVDQHARNGIEAAFETLSNQVMALRGTQKHDPLRRMGLVSDAAEMFGHLARTPIGARTGMAGIFTEGVPAILMAGLHNKSITVAARTAIEMLKGVTNRNHLKGMLAGISFLRSHVPYEIASVSNTESINRNWLEKTFTNPIKNIGRAQGPVSKLKMTIAAMHRMSAGLGGEDAFQAAVTNAAVYAEMYRMVSHFEHMSKLSKALYESGPVTEKFDKLARDAGFGPDPLYAEQLNQARLLDPEAIRHMIEMDKAVGGKLVDPEGVMDFGLMEEAMLKNPSKGREWQRTVSAIQAFKETRSRSYVTVPGIQDIPTPSGGLSPFDKMSLIFTSFQRSWFSNTMLNTIQHGPMLHSMALLTSVFFGELLYYNIYRMLYRGMTLEEIQSEFEESPTASTMSALARTNFFGSASALGQVTMDIFSDKFASGAGSMYPVNTSVKFLTATANTIKAAISGEQEVDVRDARRIENMAAGLNSWWFQAIVRATGYKGISDALYDEQTNK